MPTQTNHKVLTMARAIHLIAICGSLRASSRNRALLLALQSLAPAAIRITIFEQLAAVPPFNPDLPINALINTLSAQISAADGLIIASPEYAHGVSGVMKNLLDWLVATPALVDKPVMQLNAAPRAQHAFAALKEILQTMSAQWITEASITVPIIGAIETHDDIINDAAISATLRTALTDFALSIENTCLADTRV